MSHALIGRHISRRKRIGAFLRIRNLVLEKAEKHRLAMPPNGTFLPHWVVYTEGRNTRIPMGWETVRIEWMHRIVSWIAG